MDYFDKNFVKTTNLCAKEITQELMRRNIFWFHVHSLVSQILWKKYREINWYSTNHILNDVFSRKFLFFHNYTYNYRLCGKKEKFRQINYQVHHNVRIRRIFSVKSTYVVKICPFFTLKKHFFWEKLILPMHSKHIAEMKIEGNLLNFHTIEWFAAQNRPFGI